MQRELSSPPASESVGRVDLVVPVYNEAHVLESTIDRLLTASSDWTGFPWRIMIVDNASVDGTDEVGRRLMSVHSEVAFLRIERKGRGYALRRVWTETDSEFSLYMDVDLSTEISAVPTAMAQLQDGADMVCGSRHDPLSRVTRSTKREFFSRSYNHLVNLVFPTFGFSDAQCGFKGVRLETIRPLLHLVRNNNWFFDTELMLLARYGGLDVRSIPVTWIEDLDSRVDIPGYVMENLVGLARVRLLMNSELRKRR